VSHPLRSRVLYVTWSLRIAPLPKREPQKILWSASLPPTMMVCQIFTIVISGSDRPKFGQPEVKYQDKSVCVTDKIKEYRGVPEVIASAPI